MPSTKYISVILPCYNGASTLEKSLASINQQRVKLELVFIDDGSNDQSLAIFNNFRFHKDVIIKLITRENKGFLFSLEEGIKASTGEYIARIDSDDIWYDNHLNLIINEFRINKNLVLVGSQATIINDEDQIIGSYKVPTKHEEIIKSLHKDSAFIHSSVIFSKKAYCKTPGYLIGTDIKSMLIADYNLWFELSKWGKCKNLSDATIYYRFSTKSMSRTITKYSNYSARLIVMKKVHNYYKTFPVYSFFQKFKVMLRVIQNNILSRIKE